MSAMINAKVYREEMLKDIPKVIEITTLMIVKREKLQKTTPKNMSSVVFKNHQKKGKFSVRTILVTFFQGLQYLLNKDKFHKFQSYIYDEAYI